MRRSQHQVALLIVLLLAGGRLSRAQTTPQTAPLRNVSPDEPSSQVSLSGSYYALVIGNQNYKYLGPKGSLTTPIRDATEVAKVLHDTYGFETQLLLDADRNQILTALVNYRRTLAENANLLIYYAGHGHHDRDADEAYWWPVDARLDNNANWISADDITRDIKAMPSRHVLVIADSCYSGYLAADHRAVDARMEPEKREALLAKLLSSKSRTVMSSGRDEPVTDVGAPGHSYFAAALLESLRTIPENSFRGAELLYDYVQPRVGGGSAQVPQYDWILNSGHQYGDFVFTRRVSLPMVAHAPAAPVAAAPLLPGESGLGAIARPAVSPPGINESELGGIAGPAASKMRTVGWAMTPEGTLLHTDNGFAWQPRKTVTGNIFNSLAFIDPQTGWIIEGGKQLLHTEDGGQSWTVSLRGSYLRSVAFATPQSGWILGGTGLWHTEDAGRTWVNQRIASFISASVNAIALGGPRSAWLVGIGTIFHTDDAGAHWVEQSYISKLHKEYEAATFVSEQEGWIVGADGIILHTRDGGNHWHEQSSGTRKLLSSVCFANPLSGWIVGFDGTVLHTEDGGNRWVKQQSGTKGGLFAVKFVDAKSGWAGGEGGILHTGDAGKTWVQQSSKPLEAVTAIAVFRQP